MRDSIPLTTVSSTDELIYYLMRLFSDYLFHVILLQADLVMLSALTACMCANIITVAEGLSGFANEGVLTVVVSKYIYNISNLIFYLQ